jgi:hypothetical protein
MKKHFRREGLWFKRERLWLTVYFLGPILVGLVAVIVAQAVPGQRPHVARAVHGSASRSARISD